MSLTAYLAANYLTADSGPSPSSTKKSSKKRKRPHPSTTNGITIAEDDISALIPSTHTLDSDPENDNAPLNISDHTTSTTKFRKAKTSNWKTVGAPAPSNEDQKAADAILASAAAEQSARAEVDGDEDAPQVVARDDASDDAAENSEAEDEEEEVLTAYGARAGLQSAASVTAAQRRRATASSHPVTAEQKALHAKQHDTIYRDGSGRIVNAALLRAEARRAEDEKARREAEARESVRGDVQRAQAAGRREALKEARYMDVGRGVDDVGMNEEMRARERWNDPAAGFLTENKDEERGGGGGGPAGAGGGKVKRSYKGGAEPNRYGVRPGWRWDGVDRGNGFEKTWFQARNRVKDRRELEYAWQMDE